MEMTKKEFDKKILQHMPNATIHIDSGQQVVLHTGLFVGPGGLNEGVFDYEDDSKLKKPIRTNPKKYNPWKNNNSGL